MVAQADFVLGPTKSDWDKEIALREITTEINMILDQIPIGGLVGPHAASHEPGGDDELALAASQIVSGTFADARISESSVRQYEGDFVIDWSQLDNTPTTIAGYGITDAYTKTEVDTALAAKLNRTGYTLGDVVYADAGGALVALPGQITATRKFLSQTGTGAVSAVPSWQQPAFSDFTGTITFAQLPTGNGSWDTGVGTTIIITRDLTVTGALTGTLTGNALTATALQTPRTINGVSFDGTANITVTAAAGTLTGATLNSTVVNSSLTSVGTLVAGAIPTTLLTGTISYAQLPTGGGTWANGGDLVLTSGANPLGQWETTGQLYKTFSQLITSDFTRTLRTDIAQAQSTSGNTVAPRFQALGNGSTDSGFVFMRGTGTAGNPPYFIFAKTGAATNLSTDVTLLGDANNMGILEWVGADGVDLGTQGIRIQGLTEGTPAANRMPSVLQFWTAAGLADNDIAIKMALGPAGNLGLVSGAKFYLDGVVRTGDTYFSEASANVFNLTVGGATAFQATASLNTMPVSQLVVGHTAALLGAGITVAPRFQVHGLADSGSGSAYLGSWALGRFSSLAFTKSRGGAVGSFTIVNNADILGGVKFAGDDGIDVNTLGAQVVAFITGTPAANRIPTTLLLYTAAGVADDDIAVKLAIGPTGALGIVSGQKIFYDGTALTGNTYSWESSADVMQYFAGGNMMFTYNATQMGFFGHALASRPTYTLSNVTPDRTFDPTATNINEIAMVLATHLQDEQSMGLAA